MRVDATMQRHLSLAGCIHKMLHDDCIFVFCYGLVPVKSAHILQVYFTGTGA